MTDRALKAAETVDGALVPALTAWDLKVLRAVPPHVPIELLRERGQYGVSAWQVAENARELDVGLVLSTLHGMHRRYLVILLGVETQRRVQRWVRTCEGDERAA